MLPNTVIYANLLPFIAMIFVLFFVRINPLFNKTQNKLFFISSLVMLFMLIIISIDYAISIGSFTNGYIIRRITSFLHFSFSNLIPILLILIFTNKKMNLLLYLPSLINMVLCAISMFVNLVFFISSDGGYDRGPLFFVPSLVTAFYIICLLAYSFKQRHTRSYEALFLVAVILGISFALYLEIVEYFKFLSWDFSSVFLMLYYLLLNINKSKYDSLTGAYNRSMYVQKMENINRSRSCLLAMIDINGFKSINDKQGHDEGDKLLIKLVTTAKSFMDKKNVLYRIGGDEFAIISEDTSMENFRSLVESFLEELKKFDIYCAVGYESYKPLEDIENTVRAADLKMYQNKRTFYSDKKKD